MAGDPHDSAQDGKISDLVDDHEDSSPFGTLFDNALDMDWDSFSDAVQDESAAAGGVDLQLSDLISDDNNEVVLVSDPSFDTLTLRVDSEVLSSGVADGHVTAGGQDVTGYHYLSFESGLTLYYGDGVDLQLHPVAI